MQLPVLFRHTLESGTVARLKSYEIKAHHLLVDVAEDVDAFVHHGWQVVLEGERAVEHFAELTKSAKTKSVKPDDTPIPDVPSADEADTNKAATSKGKSTAK